MTILVDAKLSSKSQVVVPRAIRELLRIGPGDRVRFVEEDGRIVLVKPAPELGENPFVLFEEWASEADQEAYADL